MKNKQQKNRARLFGAACLSGILIAGCGSTPSADTAAGNVIDLASIGPAETSQSSTDTENPASDAAPDDANIEPSEGRWHVLPPDVAAAIDADFSGDVRKIEENAFYIAEEQTIILEDGTLASSSPSSNVEIPESDLIPVSFDETTRFYLRTIHDNGASHEDTEASFQELELLMSVEMKGAFENDIFHATEIRLLKIV